jgi:hypothetical protein
VTWAAHDPFYFVDSNSIEFCDLLPRHPVARQGADTTGLGRRYLAGLTLDCRPSPHLLLLGWSFDPRFTRRQCSSCRRKFSVTSGRLFHSRKLPIREYLSVIALFTGGVKGVAALRMARDMNINPKSAFVLLHKLREAMGSMIDDGIELQGEVEIDGAYFGKGSKQANKKADRFDRRAGIVRQVVAVARERMGRTMAWAVGKESDAVLMIRQKVASGSTVHADEAGAWNHSTRQPDETRQP